jgi:hypothetical protein
MIFLGFYSPAGDRRLSINRATLTRSAPSPIPAIWKRPTFSRLHDRIQPSVALRLQANRYRL